MFSVAVMAFCPGCVWQMTARNLATGGDGGAESTIAPPMVVASPAIVTILAFFLTERPLPIAI